MRNRFGEQLERLHVEMIQMGALCEDAISAAAQALMKGDEDLARCCCSSSPWHGTCGRSPLR